MTDKTWLVRFEYTDGSVDIWEHTPYEDAKAHYDMFDESDADIYTEIQLIERDWTKDENNCNTIIERKVFG